MRIKRLSPALIALSLLGCDAPPIPTNADNQTAAQPIGRSEGAQSGSGSIGTMPGERSGAAEPSARSAWLARQGQPSRTAAASTPLPTGDAGNTNPLREQALHGQAPEARILALKALVEKDKEAALPVVEEALRDSDAEVRKQTLVLITKERIPVPSERLHEIALSDPVSGTRGAAWLGIALRGDRDLLVDALNDPNPDIRRSAQRDLDRLDEQRRFGRNKVAD